MFDQRLHGHLCEYRKVARHLLEQHVVDVRPVATGVPLAPVEEGAGERIRSGLMRGCGYLLIARLFHTSNLCQKRHLAGWLRVLVHRLLLLLLLFLLRWCWFHWRGCSSRLQMSAPADVQG